MDEKDGDLENPPVTGTGTGTIQHFEPERSWLCCTTYKDVSKFKTIIQHLELSPVQKEIIETRFLHILQNLQKRTRNHAIIYFVGHFIITVGSLFVPALISIQNSDKEYALTNGPFNVHMYWSTFAISLLVTMWNAVLTLFRIDKKYYFLNTILERLRSEGWQYMSLTGRYSGHLTPGKKPTHENQFIHFTHYVEKIKMKQIEEEYYRIDEKAQAPTTGAGTTGTGAGTTAGTAGTTGAGTGGNQIIGGIDWYPPSPDKPIPTMTQTNVPETIRHAYDSLVHQFMPSVYPSLRSPAPVSSVSSVSSAPVSPSLSSLSSFSTSAPVPAPVSSAPVSSASVSPVSSVPAPVPPVSAPVPVPPSHPPSTTAPRIIVPHTRSYHEIRNHAPSQ